MQSATSHHTALLCTAPLCSQQYSHSWFYTDEDLWVSARRYADPEQRTESLREQFAQLSEGERVAALATRIDQVR